ncbi:MAG TPA: DUF4390 domain-containing protein [Thermoanaerobaculia bacterium]|nr:DUF4390 domain-containing protein [Thermoanaerobaculia bacterium]
MLRLALSLLLVLLSTPLAADRADEAKIENLSAVADEGKVTVRFSLVNGLSNGQMVEALESGLPTSFTYIVEIFRYRKNWFDAGIARARIEVICTFNSVTREYLLNYRRDRKLVLSETYTDFPTLVARITNIEERDLFEIGDRRPNRLKVRVKADLMRGWLFYVVPWEVSTRWQETRVKAAVKTP